MNFLQQYLRFLERAIDEPISLWSDFILASDSLVDDIENAQRELDVKNPFLPLLQELKSALTHKPVDEYAIAQISVQLGESLSTGWAQAERFKTLSEQFLKRAQTQYYFQKLRHSIADSKTEQDLRQYDSDLFNNDGISFFLEYYLAAYKHLLDLPTTQQKQSFLLEKNINLGFGDLPGIQEDVKQDECLQKFIFLIVNDQSRQELLDVYYQFKSVVLATDDPNIVQEQMKCFLIDTLDIFIKYGVQRLTSTFFTPFGKLPLLKDVRSQL